MLLHLTHDLSFSTLTLSESSVVSESKLRSTKIQHGHGENQLLSASSQRNHTATTQQPISVTASQDNNNNFTLSLFNHEEYFAQPRLYQDTKEYNPADPSTWPWEFISNNNNNNNNKPYLVVCHRMEDWFYPMSRQFTIVRIMDGELPPWESTTLLLTHDHWCDEHSYVKEALRRREVADYLQDNVNVGAMDHNNNTTNTTATVSMGGWNHGVYWPALQSSDNKGLKAMMKSIRNRPALVDVRGEVFWRNKGDTCSHVDFIVDRQTERVYPDCFTVHYLQGVSSAHLRESSEDRRNGGIDAETTAEVYTHKRVPPKANPRIPFPYPKFCSFLIRRDPDALVSMFNRSSYDVDAIVRSLFFRQLSEYRPCERVTGCGGSPYNSYRCLRRYKFHITMENTLVNGYVSEKVFMGALGDGIPIYFGAPDIASFVNIKSIVHCNVSRGVIEEMRSYYPRAPRPRPFLFNRTSTGFFPTEEELLNWADGYLRPQLEPCVNRVIELDKNASAFREVVSEPFITNPDILNGNYPFRGIELALEYLKGWAGII